VRRGDWRIRIEPQGCRPDDRVIEIPGDPNHQVIVVNMKPA
jgi:hypothetical protein